MRNLTVAEWKSNQQITKGSYWEWIDIQQEAMKFMQNGYLCGELADSIVLALYNLLGLPFIVFSSLKVITITPRHKAVLLKGVEPGSPIDNILLREPFAASLKNDPRCVVRLHVHLYVYCVLAT